MNPQQCSHKLLELSIEIRSVQIEDKPKFFTLIGRKVQIGGKFVSLNAIIEKTKQLFYSTFF